MIMNKKVFVCLFVCLFVCFLMAAFGTNSNISHAVRKLGKEGTNVLILCKDGQRTMSSFNYCFVYSWVIGMGWRGKITNKQKTAVEAVGATTMVLLVHPEIRKRWNQDK